MAINVGGLVSVVIFYLVILFCGLWAAWYGKRQKNTRQEKKKSQKMGNIGTTSGGSHSEEHVHERFSGKVSSSSFTFTSPQNGSDKKGEESIPPDSELECHDKEGEGKTSTTSEEVEAMLAGRNIGWIVGPFTMTATWVGGGFLNGTAEAVYDSRLGLVWNQAPWGYTLSLIIGGLFFAKIMRGRGYITMLDPLQEKFGKRMGGLLYLPALVGETFWSAAILAALGSTIAVIMDMEINLCVIVSACIAVGYTMFGGLYSVAYTDVIQLLCIFIGLWVCVPFVLSNPHVQPVMSTFPQWKGHLQTRDIGHWIDLALLLICGGCPWQVYFQRVLSAKSVSRAVALSFLGALGCFIMSIPPFILGAAARSVPDWREVGYKKSEQPQLANESRLILPLVLQYLTPPFVSYVGLGAISAAVMSSADSSVLSASSMFTRNVYKQVFRPKAGSGELGVTLRISTVLVGATATVIAISVESVFSLWVLCSDLVYVILFPNLVCCLYVPVANTYGSAIGSVLGAVLRLCGGLKEFGVGAIIKYPFYDEERQMQLFPMRTFSMLCCLTTIISLSYLFQFLFLNNILPLSLDIFKCFQPPKQNQHKQKPNRNDVINGCPQMELQSKNDESR